MHPDASALLHCCRFKGLHCHASQGTHTTLTKLPLQNIRLCPREARDQPRDIAHRCDIIYSLLLRKADNCVNSSTPS